MRSLDASGLSTPSPALLARCASKRRYLPAAGRVEAGASAPSTACGGFPSPADAGEAVRMAGLAVENDRYSPDGSPWITVPVAATGVMGVGTGITGGTPSLSFSPAMMRRRSWSVGAAWRRALRSRMKLA